MGIDVRRVIRAKNRLHRLQKSIGGIVISARAIDAKKCIQKAIECLHEAEMILRRDEF